MKQVTNHFISAHFDESIYLLSIWYEGWIREIIGRRGRMDKGEDGWKKNG